MVLLPCSWSTAADRLQPLVAFLGLSPGLLGVMLTMHHFSRVSVLKA